MNANILKKQDEVQIVATKMKDSKAVIAFKYQGLTVEAFMQLRNELRKDGCEIQVIKNNITSRAASECGYNELTDAFSGPVAIVFSKDDIIAPAKGLFAFAKTNDKVKVVKGVVDGDVYSFEQLKELATLPSYETLLTQLAAGLLGTVSQLAIGLNLYVEQQQA